MSENLLHRELRAKSLGRAVDARLRRRLGDPERASDLVQRKIEIEMQHKRESVLRLELQQRSPHVAAGAAVVIGGVLGARWLGEPDDRPPPLPPSHAALVGDDGQEPRPQRALVPRSWRSFRHALIEASCTASSAAARSASMTAARRKAGSSSGSISCENEEASPAVALSITGGLCSMTAVIILPI